MRRLVAVSNRTLAAPPGTAPGGLAVALDGVLRQRGGLWFGWSGEIADTAETCARVRTSAGVSHVTVDLRPDEHAAFYRAYCNEALWPLCHAGNDAATACLGSTPAAYAAYLRVNRRYANTLRPLLRADDLVWVHDYHLLPFGRALRAVAATQPIGFFLHVPFPDPEVLRRFAQGSALLNDLLAYDLLGFQTADDLASFHGAARTQWGDAAVRADGSVHAAGRRVAVGVLPIGVDVDEIHCEATAARGAELVRRAYGERRRGALLVGADRLEYSKGLYERVVAYEASLALGAPGESRPRYLQVTTPARGGTARGAPLARALQSVAERINARHSPADGDALQFIADCVAHPTLMGLLRAADVGLVTPLRDGMNLVAKEFVAAQDPADPGALVLSKTAGAARELAGALQVDPRDIRGTAEAIRVAGRMPLAERRARHRDMLAVLRRNDLRAWQTRFLQQLADCHA